MFENQSVLEALEVYVPPGLNYLERLNLAYNRFNNIQIPKGIYNLANLTYLNLSNAGFTGQIPFEVSRMTRLVTLDLSNLFPGKQPLKLENPNLKKLVQNLKELRELYLDGVNISAPESEWCKALSSSLPNLSNLSLSNCLLSGPLDSSLSQLQNLSFLRLDRNNLSTKIPDSFENFPKLTTLSMSSCSLQGFFPDKIFHLPNLQNLDLSNNKLLDGNLPQFPGGGSLRNLILGYTNFSGSLPDSISNLGLLSWIDLTNCSFSGLLPSTITNLTEVVYLDFSWNKLTGLLPHFNMAKKLTHIDLSFNGLTGSLSSMHFEGLNDLVYINLGYNSLNGSIPPALFALPSLQKLKLSNNQFGGQVNEPLSTSSSQLDTLDLSSNLLEGPIPNFFFELQKLSVLLLSSNFFNGTVQMENIHNLQNLTTLELSHNSLSINASNSSSSPYPFPHINRLSLASCNLQSFPDLRNQSKMCFLDLSDNQIKGEIPNWIWESGSGCLYHLNLSHNFLQDLQKPYNIPSLAVLDLHSNQLQGDLPIPPPLAMYMDYSNNNFNHFIPADIGHSVSSAAFFSLSNNNIIGTIPESICNASYLLVLDLSNNSLSGTILKCLLSSQTLGVLNLGRNNLSGTIPDAFSPSCGLRTLDLSRNSLTGKIPGSLANCKLLEVLSVGNNKVEGIFPCTLKNSSSLRVLVLRSNRFHGELQCLGANNSWPNLQIIDIAFNNFSGYLSPRFFLGWRGMMLDNDVQLKYNNLRFNFLNLNNLYYQDTVTVTIKGFDNSQIPKGIYNLANLAYLNLSNAGFFGQIPFEVSRMTRLVTLDLSNLLPVIQPLKLENPNLRTLVQNLKDLRELYLDGVKISAPGSEWCKALSSSLPNLSSLSLSNCLLSGPLDSSLSQLQNLSFLRLDKNNLSTKIPDYFANFLKLTTLSMSSCSLQGFFPDKIFQLPTLQNLELSNNKLLHGNLPQFPRGGSLRKIILSYTNFSGSLPDSIGNLGMLSWIDLTNCNFSGLLPSTITNLTEVVYLDFSWNNLTGLLPPFNMSKKLTHIDLSRNGLIGSVSSMHFEGLNDLVYVDLGHNSLNGSIPPALFVLPSLQKLKLSNNQFGGQVIEPLSTSSSQLDTLDLSSNLLEGPIPDFFFELRNLSVLLLSSNFFNGTVQIKKIHNLQNLTTLELSHNRLSIDASNSSSSPYPFPQINRLSLASCNLQSFPDLRNQSKMSFLDLSDNQIKGEIPNWIWEAGNGTLSHLNLSYNFFQDLQKPYNISSSLTVLDLHSNQLQGDLPIPPSSAIYIDYSSNNFNHSIPDHIGNNVSFASFISLSNNNLIGAIPESICSASYLLVLDLSNNSLSGTIPKCLLSSQTLGVLNLGRNDLSGIIPDAFSPSCGLRTLDLILRSNRFHGDLQCPGVNNSWPNLQIIDIAFNNFSGYLSPGCFLSLRGMELDNDSQFDHHHLKFNFLNLNNFYYQDTVTVTIKGLFGKIPTGPQLQTFSPAFYEGNMGLCGFPLPTSCEESTSAPKSGPISKSLDFDWQFIFTGLGFGFGAALVIAPLAFVKKWRQQCNEHLEKLIKLIFPRYGFSYVRYDGKAEASSKIVDETTEDEEDNEDEDKDEIEDDTFCGRYCVFCTKVDIERKKAVHNPKCACHYSPPTFNSSPTSFSSSLLVSYRQTVLGPS
ncbi:unnamed protein product [Fraxinus pennsylvanica]|uniref:Receptor-like protein 12 n=1 Tax=Fraxinus pennsylvanica TaxID=56036 RepID=A0AAD2E7K8_9LAMI|nr:unnamed protein product [Fraxinus pennsylvanica]